MKKLAATLAMSALVLSACTYTPKHSSSATSSHNTISTQKQKILQCQELKRQMSMINVNQQSTQYSRNAQMSAAQKEYNHLGCDS